MALKVNQHILATSFPVNSSATILQGQVVVLNSSGQVVLGDDDTYAWALGWAGDQKSTLSAGSFANRAWELGDDTYASSEITVYRGAGTELYIDTTDVFTGSAPTIGSLCYVSATAGKIQTSAPGSNNVQACRVIDLLTSNSGYLDSGIPNVNVPATDFANPRTFYLISSLI